MELSSQARIWNSCIAGVYEDSMLLACSCPGSTLHQRFRDFTGHSLRSEKRLGAGVGDEVAHLDA